jgi:putative ABC transport system permease protein
MRAIIRAARGGLAGRRLQAVIIGLVVLASTAASTVALAMLADSSSPFDHAFAAARGANVSATLDALAATPGQFAATVHAPGVTAAAGPFPEISLTAQLTLPGVAGSSPQQLTITGRSSPGGPVDDLNLSQGHWPDNDSQVVTDGAGALGSTITVGAQKLSVVGMASSITSTSDAWVLPSEIPALATAVGGGTGLAGTGLRGAAQAQMLYQFSSAGTATAIDGDVAALRAALPPGALLGTASWLDARQSERSAIAPWVPFIIAFGVLALVISVLIVVNVVSGAVIAGTTRIGVLKSVGFTPAQVTACYVLMVAVPALFGCVAGAVGGNLLAIPLLSQNAQVYQVGVLGVPLWVDVTVPLAVLALTAAGAVPPALRAGRMSAVAAIATGRAPRPARGYVAQRALARLTMLPRAVTLGIAAPSARPGRTLVTVLAVVLGGVAVTFGVGLGASLDRAYVDSSRHAALPVSVTAVPAGSQAPGSLHGPEGGAGPGGAGHTTIVVGRALTAAQQHAVTVALAAQPGTLHDLAITEDHLSLPAVAVGVETTAYGGDPAWAGLALVSGHLYSGPDQVDVNTLFLTDTGTTVGSAYTLASGGHRLSVTIAGEVFQPGNQPDMFLSAATLHELDPAAGPSQYGVALKPGTDAQAYANMVSAALGNSLAVTVNGGAGHLAALASLITMLTILIIVVAGLGVLNTVALQIRERAHAIGVFKAVGMLPRQTLVMIVCSVAATGLLAGIVAVPVGVSLHHGLVPVMTRAANSGTPPSLLSVYQPWELILLALAGLLIAIVGALGPASWAARTRTVFALRAE